MNRLRIGTRGSLLALKQTEIFVTQLASIGIRDVEIIPIKTTGDRIVDRPLADIGGKALFAKEIEQALFDKRIDCAVHSLKDLEGTMPLEMLAAVLERGDPRDGLVSYKGERLEELPEGARVGTCSPRREAYLRTVRPDLTICPIRGNVDTRIRLVRENKFDATLLAVVGLSRLQLESELSQIFEVDELLPSAGQGAIAIQSLPDNTVLRDRLSFLNHSQTWNCVVAERTVLRQIEGDCRTSVAIYATQEKNDMIDLRARLWVNKREGGMFAHARAFGKDPFHIGNQVALELLK